MKSYEVVTDDLGFQAVKVENQQGIISWIPMTEKNSDYAEYLRYTAWVEAGNNPEDFWVQEQKADVLVEQPKEEKETEGEG